MEKMARRSSWYMASDRYHDAGRLRGGSMSAGLESLDEKPRYCNMLNSLMFIRAKDILQATAVKVCGTSIYGMTAGRRASP